MARNGTITSDFESMKIGDKREYPASRSMSVRSMASMLGFKWDKVFATQGDRKRKVITVIRTK